jgi:hypothetical protein
MTTMDHDTRHDPRAGFGWTPDPRRAWHVARGGRPLEGMPLGQRIVVALVGLVVVGLVGVLAILGLVIGSVVALIGAAVVGWRRLTAGLGGGGRGSDAGRRNVRVIVRED